MALKIELESIEELDEPLRDLYEEVDGKYRLKVEGIEDTGALKRAKDHEKQARKAAEDSAKTLQAQLDQIKKEQEEADLAAKKASGDDDAWRESLKKSWSTKYDQREKELLEANESLSANLRQILVDNETIKLASDIAIEGKSAALVPHIKSRLGVGEKDGKRVTVVLDEEGRESALTLDELKKEIINNPVFDTLVAGSKATGGGAAPSKGGGASQQSSGGDLSKMNREQKLEHFRNLREVM